MIKELAYDDRETKVGGIQVSSVFLCPCIEKMKITKYGKEAIIVAQGQKLWFVHSIKLLSATIKDPCQVQEYSICFKTDVNSIKIPDNQEEKEVEILSYFHQPVQVKLHVEVDVSVYMTCRCQDMHT